MTAHQPQPLVSVTIPAYNHEPFVQTAIDSVMRQSYTNIDLVVIDDGSTDTTVEKIQGCCEQYKDKIRFVSKKNEGLVRTLNLGLKMSSGKYWCQLASDDMMVERNIEKKVAFLEKNPEIDAVCSDGFCLHPDQTRTRMIPEKVKPDPLRIKNIKDLFCVKMIFPSLLIRKSVFDRIGTFDESMRYYEDIEMKPRLLLNCKVGYIDEPLFVWRSHASNTSKESAFTRKEKIIAYKKIFSLPKMRRHRVLKRKILGDEYYKYAKFLIDNRQTDGDHSASWYLFRSLSLHPFRPVGYYLFFRTLFEATLR